MRDGKAAVGNVDGEGDGRGVGSKLHSTTMSELGVHPELVDSIQFPDTSARSSSELIYMYPLSESQPSGSWPMTQ